MSPFNVTTRKPQYTRLMQRIYDSSLRDTHAGLPRPVRGALRPLLFRKGSRVSELYQESGAPLPDRVVETLHAENERLRRLLGVPALPWEVEAKS